MRTVFLLLAPIAALLLSGCIGVNLPKQQIQKTGTYDLLPVPAADSTFAFEVEIVPFYSDSPAKFKMLHRKGTVLSADEYSKWGQGPAQMLTRLFRSAFLPDKMTEQKFRLSGTVLRFEADDETRTAELTVKYTLTSQSSADPLFIRKLTVSEKMKENTPQAFAEAMSQAVLKQIKEVKALILKAAQKK